MCKVEGVIRIKGMEEQMKQAEDKDSYINEYDSIKINSQVTKNFSVKHFDVLEYLSEKCKSKVRIET